MVVSQLNGSMLCSGLTNSRSEGRIVKHMKASISPQHYSRVGTFSPLVNGRRLDHASIVRHCNLSIKQQRTLLSFPAMTCRSRKVFTAVNNRWSSDCSTPSADVEEGLGTGGDDTLSFSSNYELLDAAPQGTYDQSSTDNAISQLHSQDIKQELIMLFLPAIAGQAIDPLAQLMETAYIGRLGSLELASAGVSVSIFNIISKLFNIPLLSVATSFVAEDIAKSLSRTSTPGVGNFTAIFLFPTLMYHFRLGVTGAALSTVLSQYIVTILMIWLLNQRAVLLPPKLRALQFGGYIKSGGFLLGRTLATVTTMTLGTSMAARQGPLAMAAHQICLQVWLAVSLLTDALASSGQALIASYLSKRDYSTVKEIAHFVLKIGLVTGVISALVLSVSFSSLANLFTKDTEVLKIIRTGVLISHMLHNPWLACELI